MKLLVLLLLCLPAYGQDMLAHIDRTNGTSEWHHIRKAAGKLTDMGVTTPKAFTAAYGLSRPVVDAQTIATFPRTSTLTIIPATYADGTGLSVPLANIQAGAQIVANLYQEMSYGKETLNVVVAPVTNSGVAAGGCPWVSILEAVDINAFFTPATGNSVNFTLVAGPYDASCGFLGVALIGYPAGYINGYDPTAYPKVYGHELGHEFGLQHAGSISGTSVAEYGDAYSMMGNQYASHFNAAQKSILGWITPDQIATPAANSVNTYNLTALETPGGSTYAVKVAMNGQTYWIEDREPIGFDSMLPASGQVRLAAPLAIQCSGCADDTEVLGTLPTAYPWQIAGLTVTVQQGTVTPPVTPPVNPPPVAPPTQNYTAMPPAKSLTDAKGNVYSLLPDGNLLLNGFHEYWIPSEVRLYPSGVYARSTPTQPVYVYLGTWSPYGSDWPKQ